MQQVEGEKYMNFYVFKKRGKHTVDQTLERTGFTNEGRTGRP